MTVWVVTGSRPPKHGPPYTERELQIGDAIMGALFRPGDGIVTGGAIGWDARAMRYGFEHGLAVTTLLPNSDEFTDWEAVRLYSGETINTGAGYWRRDAMEVARGEAVVAFPLFERHRSSRLSGTWHTWDVAEREGKAMLMWVVRPRDRRPGVYMIGGAERYMARAFRAVEAITESEVSYGT